MPPRPHRAVEIQRKYYTDAADRYDSMHAHEGATDTVVMDYSRGVLRTLRTGGKGYIITEGDGLSYFHSV
jgi:hypothetical protein